MYFNFKKELPRTKRAIFHRKFGSRAATAFTQETRTPASRRDGCALMGPGLRSDQQTEPCNGYLLAPPVH